MFKAIRKIKLIFVGKNLRLYVLTPLVFSAILMASGHQSLPKKPTVINPFQTVTASKINSIGLDTPVLMYHYIRTVEQPQNDTLGFSLSVTPQDFEQQISYLQKNNYHSITPGQLYEALERRTPLPEKPVVLTFDDGYEDFYTTAYPVLKKYNAKATIFVVSGFVSDANKRYLTWEQLSELDKSGLITIGAHTEGHKDLTRALHPLDEVRNNKFILENFLGHYIDTFAYPSGMYNSKTIELIKNEGFKLAFTTKFGIHHASSDNLAMSRVRISGGLSMDKFIERLSGKLTSNFSK